MFEPRGASVVTKVAGLTHDVALRLEIETLNADYAHCIDDDRLEQWPEFFTADGRYRVVTRENHDLGLPVSLIYCDGGGLKLAERTVVLDSRRIDTLLVIPI